jgi:hypothetical protein
MTDAELAALEAAARAATPGPWFRAIANDTAIRSDDVDIAQTVGAYELEWERMEADAAYIAAANPAAILALIQRVREAEGRALRISWEDLGPSMVANAFLGSMDIGGVHPHVNGGWCWAASNLPAEGYKDDKADAKAALETAVMEAMRHD